MTKHYIVAGHRFDFTMQDDCPLWAGLGNYAPFEVAESDREPVFSLEFVYQMEKMKKVPVYVEKAEDPDQPRIEIFHRAPDEADPEGKEWIIEMAPVQKMDICARLVASPDFRSGRVAVAHGRVGEFAINNAMMILYAFTTAPMGTLEMHSSVIKREGYGYMFLGKSGTGKSTHSNLWLKYIEGSELLNDDNPVLRVGEDGVARVYGSPWSGKTPCYKNDSVPVGAIVRLNQYPENRISRNSLVEAYAAVYPSCSGFRALSGIADGMHSTIEKVVLSIPCFTLDCLPDEAAALLSCKTISR
ncbi:MAG: hypothetical protein J5699_03375 [Bacteroidales bacterium]|nr:hypothetical protein [Bacteroidales bacterium]